MHNVGVFVTCCVAKNTFSWFFQDKPGLQHYLYIYDNTVFSGKILILNKFDCEYQKTWSCIDIA